MTLDLAVKHAAQVPCGAHLSSSPPPVSLVLQHQLLLRLLTIDVESYQSRKSAWLLGQHLAFILATEDAIWLWGALWTGKKKVETGSGPIDFWGIGDDIEEFLVLFPEIKVILHRQYQLWVGVSKGHTQQELLTDLDGVLSVFYWTMGSTSSSRKTSYQSVILGSLQGWGGGEQLPSVAAAAVGLTAGKGGLW